MEGSYQSNLRFLYFRHQVQDQIGSEFSFTWRNTVFVFATENLKPHSSAHDTFPNASCIFQSIKIKILSPFPHNPNHLQLVQHQ